jgi:hypothetical protein
VSPDVTTVAMKTRSKEHEMKQATNRFRRFAVTCIVAVTAVSGLSVLGLAGVAGAAAGPGSAVTGVTQPAIGATGTNQPAGNFKITLAAGTTWSSGNQITLSVASNTGAGTITFDHAPTFTEALGAGDVDLCLTANSCTVTGAGTSTITITFTNLVSQTAATTNPTTITLSNIGYTTAAAGPGYVKVTVGGSAQGAIPTGPLASSANATVNSSALAVLTSPSPSPLIGPGATSAAAIWNLYLNGIGNQWVTGDKYYITVAHNDATNCETVAKPDTIAFSGTPAIIGGATSGAATTVPTATATLAAATGSSCGVNNELVITFTNSGTITTANAGSVNLAIVGVKYAVSSDTYTTGTFGTGTNLGPITVAGGYNTPPTFSSSGNTTPLAVANDVLVGGSNLSEPGGGLSTALEFAVSPAANSITTDGLSGTIPSGTPLFLGTPGATGTELVTTTANAGPGGLGTTIAITTTTLAHSAGDAVVPCGPSNATIGVSTLVVVSNKPSTTIQLNETANGGGEAVNQAVSPITITEGSPGSLGGGVVGWACIALSPNVGVGAAAEFATLPTVTATGGGIAVGNVSLLTPGSQTGPSELAFQVTTASSGTPGTVTVSGISLNVPDKFGFFPDAALVSGANSVSDACTGANSDPAVAPPSGTRFTDPTGNPYFTVFNVASRIWGQTQDDTAAQVFEDAPPSCVNSLSPTTPAVLVTNGSYQDALSASYLAGQLDTGVLTTNTSSISPAVFRALALEGVTQVFVVGGPLVVTPADITQLENTPSYRCPTMAGPNGTTPRTNITGQIEDLQVQQIYGQTADDTAGAVATFAGAGAPGSANFQGAYGGAYNDTSGSSGSPVSSAPDTSVPTAILATDRSFTDAASASAVAYSNHFPLLLTGQATLSSAASAALTNDSIQQVLVMGGPIAISDNVLSQIEAMGITVVRIAGQDFTDTSQLLAQFELASINIAGQQIGLEWDPGYLSIARGDYYTDAIVVSRISDYAPILLTWDPNSTFNPGGTDYLGKFLTTAGSTGWDLIGRDGSINNLQLVGGVLAISNALATTLGHDLNG